MSDIFFSYSSKDRDFVTRAHDALLERSFDVFWDQKVPTGKDWDGWIREHLAQAKCVVVFWSQNSAISPNVRHEATIARDRGILVPALIDEVGASSLPLGMLTVEAANLKSWSGNPQDPEWQNLLHAIESLLTPGWLRARAAEVSFAVDAERKRHHETQSKLFALETVHNKELQAQASLMTDLRRQIQQLSEQGEHQTRALKEAEVARSQLTERLSDAHNKVEMGDKGAKQAHEQQNRLKEKIIALEDLLKSMRAQQANVDEMASAKVSAAYKAMEEKHGDEYSYRQLESQMTIMRLESFQSSMVTGLMFTACLAPAIFVSRIISEDGPTIVALMLAALYACFWIYSIRVLAAGRRVEGLSLSDQSFAHVFYCGTALPAVLTGLSWYLSLPTWSYYISLASTIPFIAIWLRWVRADWKRARSR